MQALSGLCVLPPLEKGHRYVFNSGTHTKSDKIEKRKAPSPSGVPNDLNKQLQLEGNCIFNDYRRHGLSSACACWVNSEAT